MGTPQPSVRDYVRDYVFGRCDRRAFLRGLVATGVSAAVARGYLELLAPAAAAPVPGVTMAGRGGDLLAAQLRTAGTRFVFANPSTGSGPFFDAFIDDSQMQIIIGLQEDTLSAMADGYAKASGTVPFVIVARPGFPSTLGTQFNAWRDRVPMVFCTDNLDEARRGRFAGQEVDDLLACARPFTRWRWESRREDKLAEDLRRAFKFAASPPCGPVFLSVPHDLLAMHTRAEIYPQSAFDISHQIRAGAAEVEEVARRLLDAQSPLLYVGNEVHRYGAEAEIVELAEMLGIPVMQQNFGWCNAFPTAHPLYLGTYQPRARHPAAVDFMLDLGGGRGPYQRGTEAVVPRDRGFVQVKLDLDSMGRVAPAHLSIPANVRLFTRDLIDAVRARAGSSRLRALREPRSAETAAFTVRAREAAETVARQRWGDVPLAHERLGMELEQHLDRRACIVHEADASRVALRYLDFGPDTKHFYTISGLHMGWAVGAAVGVKLAQPDRQVLALIGDGGFMFGGSQILWTAKRYEIPIIVLVANNRSYDGERTRIWSRSESLQAKLGKDMACYIGDPDVEFTELAAAYGVEALKVSAPDELAPALGRAAAVTESGQPVLLDVLVGRRGPGAESSWYPRFSLAAQVAGS